VDTDRNRHGDSDSYAYAYADSHGDCYATNPDAYAYALLSVLPLVALMNDSLASPHCAKGTARVSADSHLRVRADPNPEATIVGHLAPGELVTVWAIVDEWAIVQTVNGLTGWANTTYLKAEDVYRT
jgi:uncharacterized protein YgiM (DUF1202 family)